MGSKASSVGHPDATYVRQFDRLRDDVEELRKLLVQANKEHQIAVSALDKIRSLSHDIHALHGAELGRAKEIAEEAHGKEHRLIAGP